LGGTWRINEPANFDISRLVIIPTSLATATVTVTFVHGAAGGVPFERSASATFNENTSTLTTAPIRKFQHGHLHPSHEFHTVGLRLNGTGGGNKAIVTQSVNVPQVVLTGDFTRV
jgi:hypothetical protein